MKHTVILFMTAVAAASAQTLQERVDAALPGEVILAPPGRYDTGGRQMNGTGTLFRVVVDKPVTLRSEGGPDQTFIIGGENTRCVYLAGGAVLSGFTVKDGNTGEDGEALNGGGVLSETNGLVFNCILAGNTARHDGGGLYGGRAEQCVFTANRAGRSGGGAAAARLDNCLLYDNRAKLFGGGARGGALRNCTVVRNQAETFGGGAAYGEAHSCVLWLNETPQSYRNYYNMNLQLCCSSPAGTAPGNISADPRFQDFRRNVFTPTLRSPLVDGGADNGLTNDFSGGPRALDGNNDGLVRPDIGAFEYVHPLADSDRDGINDREAARRRQLSPE